MKIKFPCKVFLKGCNFYFLRLLNSILFTSSECANIHRYLDSQFSCSKELKITSCCIQKQNFKISCGEKLLLVAEHCTNPLLFLISPELIHNSNTIWTPGILFPITWTWMCSYIPCTWNVIP